MVQRARALPLLTSAPAGEHTGVLAVVIGLGGLILVFAWLGWRFGPTIARYCGFAFWWIGWACGIGGGYGYAIFFLAGGTLSWGAGTVWYAARRGYWPSLVSERIFAAASRSREVRRRAR
jgi:hypothetical protein